MRAIVIGMIMLACWMSGAGIASAHTALKSSDPAADATVESPPTVITLTFSEDINPTFATVVVKSADGRDWISGPPRVEGPRLDVSMRSDLPGSGIYTVGYRVVSADGHPVSGSYVFTIAEVANSPASASPPTGNTSTASAPPESAAPPGPDTKTSILIAGATGLALGCAIAFWQSRRHRRSNALRNETPSAEPPTPGDETDGR